MRGSSGRSLSGAIALTVLYFLITYIPSVRLVKDWYGQASPTAQVTFLVIILLILIVMVVIAVDGGTRPDS